MTLCQKNLKVSGAARQVEGQTYLAWTVNGATASPDDGLTDTKGLPNTRVNASVVTTLPTIRAKANSPTADARAHATQPGRATAQIVHLNPGTFRSLDA